MIDEATATEDDLAELASPLLRSGVAIVAITLGASGAYVCLTDDAERLQAGAVLRDATSSWRVGESVRLPALPLEGELNANGAGDAFTAVSAQRRRETGRTRVPRHRFSGTPRWTRGAIRGEC